MPEITEQHWATDGPERVDWSAEGRRISAPIFMDSALKRGLWLEQQLAVARGALYLKDLDCDELLKMLHPHGEPANVPAGKL